MKDGTENEEGYLFREKQTTKSQSSKHHFCEFLVCFGRGSIQNGSERIAHGYRVLNEAVWSLDKTGSQATVMSGNGDWTEQDRADFHLEVTNLTLLDLQWLTLKTTQIDTAQVPDSPGRSIRSNQILTCQVFASSRFQPSRTIYAVATPTRLCRCCLDASIQAKQ